MPPAPGEGFVAKVKSQTPPASPGQPWQLQLDVGGRSLTVTSERSLPPGSSLVLTVSKDNPPVLQVQAIQLPAANPLGSLTGSAPKSLESQLLAAAMQLRQSPSLPSAVRELLAARIPFYAQPGSLAATPAKAASGQSAPVPSTSVISAGASDQKGVNAPTSMLSLLTHQSADRRVNAYNEMAAYQAPPKGSPSGNTAQQSSLPTPAAGTATAQLLNLLSKELMPGSVGAGQSHASAKSAQLPAETRQVLQDFIRSLPSQEQLSQASTLKRAVSNNPLNFEKQALNHVLQKLAPDTGKVTTGTQKETMMSAENLTGVLRHLWKTGSANTSGTTESLQSLIQQLTSASQHKASVTDVNGLPGSLPAHQQLPPELSRNLKGLLLLISRQILQAGHSAGTASAATQGTAAADPGPALQAETFRLLQSVLARTEQEQVRLVQQQDPYPASIPLLYNDGQQARQIGMEIHHDADSDEDGGHAKKICWHITLHFDLEQLGPMDVELELLAAGVSARFWSEQTQTLSQLNTSLQPLRQQLTALGAEVGELEVRHGRKLPEDQQLTIKHSLVDIRT